MAGVGVDDKLGAGDVLGQVVRVDSGDSGTRWKPIRDPGTAGSALVAALSPVAPSATVRPRTAAQKLATAWASWASKLTANTVLDMIWAFLSCCGMVW
jgi:hypothetical protein